MSKVGKSEIRVDAFDKVTGRTKYYEDRMPAGALYARIKHSTIAHGFVKSVDKSAAEAIPGVVKVLTCFDVPEHCFPTAGHPWSMDPGHQDVADRNLLNRHVRYYGDDVAVVIAENEVSAMQGVRALKVEYEELPFVLDVQKAMEPDAPCIHENFPGNILKHTDIRKGNYQQAIKEPGLIKVEAGTTPPPCSTATLKTTAATLTRKMAASSSCPPRRSRTSSAASSVRRSGVRGRISASSSPTSAEALATSRMRSMSHCARGALRRCTENACASTARVKRHSSVTVCATRSASISSRGSIRTARLPRARSSASPIRRVCLARPFDRRQGHGLVPADLSLRQFRGRRLHRVHKPPRRRRDARLRHAAGVVRGRREHRRVREGRWHGAARIPHEVHHAQGLPRRLLR